AFLRGERTVARHVGTFAVLGRVTGLGDGLTGDGARLVVAGRRVHGVLRFGRGRRASAGRDHGLVFRVAPRQALHVGVAVHVVDGLDRVVHALFGHDPDGDATRLLIHDLRDDAGVNVATGLRPTAIMDDDREADAGG